MIKVSFYENTDDKLLEFAVIIAKKDGRFVFCKHRERETLEIPGGHREEGENILDTAKRELYEETGAKVFEIRPVCVYSVADTGKENGEETFGMLYYAEISELEPKLHNEIERIVFSEALPENWTYPLIQPELIKEAARRNIIS